MCSSKPQVNFPDVKDNWITMEGVYARKPLVVSYNQGLEPIAGNKVYENQVGISIKLNTPDKNGQAVPEEDAQLGMIRETLAGELTKNKLSFFAVVSTTDGSRDFVFYTHDVNAMKEKIETIKKKISTHRISISVLRDPHWGVYKQFNPSQLK